MNEYILNEVKKVIETHNKEFNFKIKIVGSNNETKFLDLNATEFKKLLEIFKT